LVTGLVALEEEEEEEEEEGCQVKTQKKGTI
jgi:hypothetical protein